MPTYTSKYSKQNTAYKEKYAGGQGSQIGFAIIGTAKIGQAKTTYSDKYSKQNNSYTAKYT